MNRGGSSRVVTACRQAFIARRPLVSGAVLLAFSTLLASCGAYSAKLRTWNDEGRFEDARDRGAAWLARHADEADTAEWRAVDYEQARGDLGEVPGLEV